MKKKLYLCFVITALILISWLVIYLLSDLERSNDFEDYLSRDCQNCNVILIVIDTLRQDHIGSYGYLKNTTPTLNKISDQSFLFSNNYSASNWTLPSMISMFTGVYPQHHLVDNRYSQNDPGMVISLDNTAPHLLTIAQYFQKYGYKTAGFTGGAGVSSEAGFNKGFDVYYDDQDFVGFETTIPEALNWLEEVSQSDDDKHFLFLHGYDVHGQYAGNDEVKSKLSSSYVGDLDGSTAEHIEIRDQYHVKGQVMLNTADKQFLVDRYDDKILAMDERLREFLLGYYEVAQFNNPTIFIITSDHGEEWFDHGGIDHGLTLYQEVVKTPLIIHLPDQTKKIEVKDRISSIDLLPTILGLVKIPLDDHIEIDGVSFLSNFKGLKSSGEILFHSNYRHITSLRGGVNQDNKKIFVDLKKDSQELYDLDKDDQEKNNLTSSNSFKNDRMLDWLGQFFWEINL